MTTAKRGRPIKKTAFSNVCRTTASVYLAGLGNGLVKVGFSDNPRSRLSSLNYYAIRKFGGSIDCFHVYEGIGSELSMATTYRNDSSRARAIEARLIGLLATHGRACKPSVEFFDGIGYAKAKALIDAELRNLKAEA